MIMGCKEDLRLDVRQRDGGGEHGVWARGHRLPLLLGSQFHCSRGPNYRY